MFDKDDILEDKDTEVARIELSDQSLLALRSVGCHVNGASCLTAAYALSGCAQAGLGAACSGRPWFCTALYHQGAR